MSSPHTSIGLYIHIPFCTTKCSYCDFYSVTTGFSRMGSVVENIIKEIDTKIKALNNPEVKTIFIGGGTPSSLPNRELSTLLKGIKRYIDRAEEVTIEANPETISKAFLDTIGSHGVTRLSMGVQSFNDRLLKILGRNCNSSRSKKAIELVKHSWKGEYSIDLISSIPTQTIDDIKGDISQALEYRPDHISFYSLILEEGTELEDRVSKGEIEELEPSLEEDIWLYTRDRLTESGYTNYEVSNFYLTKPSLHNLNYWELKPYLGAGPGAVSTILGDNGEVLRVENPRSIDRYIKEDDYGSVTEVIEPKEFLKEYIMMGFRLRSGIYTKRFNSIFGNSLSELIPIYSDLLERKLIEEDSTFVKLSSKGYDLMNSVLVEILDSMDSVKLDKVNWFY